MLDKMQIRILQKNKLKSQNHIKGHKAANLALWLIKKLKAKNILLYAPLPYEPDIFSLRRNFSLQNRKLFLPFMLDESLKIVKLRAPFKKGRFGVRESANSLALKPKIDVALIPVIAVDANMARIGHGKGFYDRFFANFKPKPCVIFISNADSFIKAKICQPHDIICDFYITSQKIRIKYDRNTHRSSCLRNQRRCWIFGS